MKYCSDIAKLQASCFGVGRRLWRIVPIACTDSDGNLYIVDEHAQRGWVPERHAEAVKAMLQRHRIALAPVHYIIELMLA